ncbi:hypothetical protein [Arthrobacter sp. B10-11]|nr:hypothetical protein [Arthrobacter sp. B10-11]
METLVMVGASLAGIPGGLSLAAETDDLQAGWLLGAPRSLE